MNAEIRRLIAAHAGLPVSVETLTDQADLHRAGLTSFATVQLMLALEEAFDVEFEESMLNRRTFASIAAMQGALAQLAGSQAAAA